MRIKQFPKYQASVKGLGSPRENMFKDMFKN